MFFELFRKNSFLQPLNSAKESTFINETAPLGSNQRLDMVTIVS